MVSGPSKRILMVAYHYPPVRVSSGIQRTLKFSAYLRDHGWEPIILTVSPRAYERVSDDQMAEIPDGIIVKRAFGLDTSRHLAVKGRYLGWMAQPDRWISWWPAAVWCGSQLVRRHKPDVIMSTYPIATAHLIAYTLSRRTALPWVADFRDSMTEPGYPADPRTWKIHRALERRFVRQCARAIFTAPGTLQMYAERYGEIPRDRWSVIENGFDEENFRDAEQGLSPAPLSGEGRITLIHSGLLYPQERDPRPFFAALSRLLRAGDIDPRNLRIVLRATGGDELYARMLAESGLLDIVRIEPTVSYQAALREMLRADGLLLFQAAMCNHQIPAKLYEYMRAGKPILSLTDPAGNTAEAARKAGATDIVNIGDTEDIERGLRDFIARIRSGAARGVDPAVAAAHSRRARTAELAHLLEGLDLSGRGR